MEYNIITQDVYCSIFHPLSSFILHQYEDKNSVSLNGFRELIFELKIVKDRTDLQDQINSEKIMIDNRGCPFAIFKLSCDRVGLCGIKSCVFHFSFDHHEEGIIEEERWVISEMNQYLDNDNNTLVYDDDKRVVVSDESVIELTIKPTILYVLNSKFIHLLSSLPHIKHLSLQCGYINRVSELHGEVPPPFIPSLISLNIEMVDVRSSSSFLLSLICDTNPFLKSLSIHNQISPYKSKIIVIFIFMMI